MVAKSYDGIPTGQALLVGLDRWLRLRWWLAPAEVVAIAAAGPIPPKVSLWSLVLLFVFAPLPGIVASRLRHRRNARLLVGGFILVDLGLLTVALTLCDGTSNPFSVLYLVYVTLACVLLGPGYGWAATAVAAGLYACLFVLTPTEP